MSTKSSRIPSYTHSQKPARVPSKWRNLPAYGMGITPAMKARPIIATHPNDDESADSIGDMCELLPVPMISFMIEHAEIVSQGYHMISQDSYYGECPMCGCKEVVSLQYAKRHRNGKPNHDWTRDFTLCAQCLTVGETVFVERALQKFIDQEGDNPAA